MAEDEPGDQLPDHAASTPASNHSFTMAHRFHVLPQIYASYQKEFVLLKDKAQSIMAALKALDAKQEAVASCEQKLYAIISSLIRQSRTTYSMPHIKQALHLHLDLVSLIIPQKNPLDTQRYMDIFIARSYLPSLEQVAGIADSADELTRDLRHICNKIDAESELPMSAFTRPQAEQAALVKEFRRLHADLKEQSSAILHDNFHIELCFSSTPQWRSSRTGMIYTTHMDEPIYLNDAVSEEIAFARDERVASMVRELVIDIGQADRKDEIVRDNLNDHAEDVLYLCAFKTALWVHSLKDDLMDASEQLRACCKVIAQT